MKKLIVGLFLINFSTGWGCDFFMNTNHMEASPVSPEYLRSRGLTSADIDKKRAVIAWAFMDRVVESGEARKAGRGRREEEKA